MKTNKFIFVLMPFDKVYDDIYLLGIKPTCEELEIYCERVDEQIFQERILDRIYNQITKADLIIADMTGRNANVFYEVGYAHALNKNVILLTQKTEDIPFDLNQFPHIIYEGQIIKLKKELKRKLTFFIKEPDKSIANFFMPVKLYYNGKVIENNPIFHVAIINSTYNWIETKIDLKNTSKEIFEEEVQIGLEVPKDTFIISKNFNEVKTEKSTKLYITKKKVSLFPESWDSIQFKIQTIDNTGSIIVNETIRLKVFIYTKYETIQKGLILDMTKM